MKLDGVYKFWGKFKQNLILNRNMYRENGMSNFGQQNDVPSQPMQFLYQSTEQKLKTLKPFTQTCSLVCTVYSYCCWL